MRFRSVVSSSLVLVLLLTLGTPLAAAPRNGDDPRWERPLHRIVKVIKKFFGITTTGDGMIVPIP